VTIAGGLAVFARLARKAGRRRRELLSASSRPLSTPPEQTQKPPPGAPLGHHPAPMAGAATTVGVSTTGKFARNLELARMTSRIGRSAALSTSRQVFASAGRRQELRVQRQLRTTAEVVETLGSMKGAWMKIGQMASYLDAGLPENVRHSLAALQAETPPMAPELAASVVRAELGASPESIFAEWDPVPIAAASIGQVHRAITADGRAVAVKVQYPGVDDAIRADLDSGASLLNMINRLFPGLDAEALAAELRDRVVEELDYELEAANQQTFADRFVDHPFIHVPPVVAELSTARVLTSGLVDGAHYEEVRDWPQQKRDTAGEAIFRFVFGCLYRMQAFNGDPHPGNYLFHGSAGVTFLDFGLVKWFTDGEVALLAEMVKSLVTTADPRAFRSAVESAGFLLPDPNLSDEQVTAYFRQYYELVLADGPVTFSPSYASETLRHFFDAGDPVVKRANVPPPFVVLQRINLGLYAVLAGLGATANWRRIADEIWPWVGAPPSTRLGAQEAEWAAAHPDAAGPARRPACRWPVAGGRRPAAG
jgi:predicted unusual protein kinase regulating ubiquinone biosynthesis (AarF/ABC1/UbiB family)